MSETLIFNELDKLVSIPLASGSPEKDKWQRIPYETTNVKGVGLLASETVDAGEIALELNVKGYYRIYLCLGQIAESGVEIWLDREGERTVLCPSETEVMNGVHRWQLYERAEEVFYRVADLTGQKIVLCNNKTYTSPVKSRNVTSFVLYVKLQKMTDEEVESYQSSNQNPVICYHFDSDYYGECDYPSAKSYLGRVGMLEHGNGDMLIVETNVDQFKGDLDKFPYKNSSQGFTDALEHFKPYGEEFYRLLRERCDTMGMRLYSGYRMGWGDFAFPYSPASFVRNFSKLSEDRKCETRTGKKTGAYSYAFREVRDCVIRKILDTTPRDFDGVSLFFHRGFFILFEAPVYDRVMELYGVDCHRLPFGDPRLSRVLGEFMTLFLRELRSALDEKAKRENRERYLVNAIVYQNLESCQSFGLDVETWAAEGLIDSFSQGIMYLFEDLEGCMGVDGLIDMEKYRELIRDHVLLRRKYHPSVELSMASIPQFLEISEKYRVDFYGSLAWESNPASFDIDLAENMYRAGVKKLICWNAGHFCKKPSLLNVIKECGNIRKVTDKEVRQEKTVVRVLSVNGNDISEFDVNWNG